MTNPANYLRLAIPCVIILSIQSATNLRPLLPIRSSLSRRSHRFWSDVASNVIRHTIHPETCRSIRRAGFKRVATRALQLISASLRRACSSNESPPGRCHRSSMVIARSSRTPSLRFSCHGCNRELSSRRIERWISTNERQTFEAAETGGRFSRSPLRMRRWSTLGTRKIQSMPSYARP